MLPLTQLEMLIQRKKTSDKDQEPIRWGLHLPHKPLESTLSRVDL